jgi:hypothetical protein
MKWILVIVSLLVLTSHIVAAPKSATGRTIEEVDIIPTRVLQRAISPKFYESLRISPIRGHIVVRAQLIGTKVSGGRVVKSDLGGAYDRLAVDRANEIRIWRHYKLDSQSPMTPVLLHLMIYEITDGTMALSFANLDGPGDDQLDYFGCAKLSVLKSDGSWAEIKGPSTLHNKGIMVRATGVKNNRDAIRLLERVK